MCARWTSLFILAVNSEEIVTTDNHPFYVQGRGFIEAVNLLIDDKLISVNGEDLVIEEFFIEETEEPVDVYNFQVEDYHTYFVGENKVWVHNLECGQTSTAFEQEEFASTSKERISKTPSEKNMNVEFTGERGNSKCIPKDKDSSLAKTLNDCGVDGIEYKNGVADLSPTSKAEVQIDHMVGGTGKMGTEARQWNFGQADNAMASELNADPSAASRLGITPKNGDSFTASDVSRYRTDNNLTWHELNDTKTMQLVPTEVNAKFTHLGGVGEINAGAYCPGGFANN